MNRDLYVRYPILDLNYGQRFAKRVVRSVLGIVLSVSAVVLLLSDVPNLVLAGTLTSVYLMYVFIAGIIRSQPKAKFKGGNLARFTTKRTRKAIFSAYDRSAFLGGSFLLHLARELVEAPMVIRVLKGLEVDRNEFVSKLESYMDEERDIKETNKWRQVKVEEVVTAALTEQDDEKKPIEPFHLFVALPQADNENIRTLFAVFGLDAEKLEKIARYYAVII